MSRFSFMRVQQAQMVIKVAEAGELKRNVHILYATEQDGVTVHHDDVDTHIYEARNRAIDLVKQGSTRNVAIHDYGPKGAREPRESWEINKDETNEAGWNFRITKTLTPTPRQRWDNFNDWLRGRSALDKTFGPP
jgi:hypothetical protein